MLRARQELRHRRDRQVLVFLRERRDHRARHQVLVLQGLLRGHQDHHVRRPVPGPPRGLRHRARRPVLVRRAMWR